MQDIVTRGDRNGDAALDREEIRAIASSSVVVGQGKGMPPPVSREIHVTQRPPPESVLGGLIDDLKLPPDRRAQAFAAVGQAEADTTRAVLASIETLRDQVRALVTREQFAILDTGIQNYAIAIQRFLGPIAAPAGRPALPVPILELESDREGRALGVSADALAGLKSAVDGHMERMRALATDRSGLLRHMTPVLTADELADFTASLERHRAILNAAGALRR